MDKVKQGKGRGQPPSAALLGMALPCGVKSQLVRVGKVYPCRDESPREVVSTVKDDLVKVVWS